MKNISHCDARKKKISMDDLKKLLEFNNNSIKLQGLSRLVTQVDAQLQTNKDCLTTSATETAGLKLLWECCGDDNTLVCSSSCQTILRLLHEDKADYTYVLRGLLNLLPTARRLDGIVSALTDLLVHQALSSAANKHIFHSPYSIRSPPHPFISVLKNRPGSWPLLQQEIYRLFTWPNNRVQQDGVFILEPFIKFLLLEPVQGSEYAALRQCAVSTLLQTPESSRIIGFILRILPCMQVETLAQMGEAIHLLERLLWRMEVVDKQAGQLTEDDLPLVFSYCLQLCQLASSKGHTTNVILTRLLQLDKAGHKVIQSGQDVITCGSLLSCFSQEQTSIVLQLLLSYLKREQLPQRHLVNGMLCLPCLRILGSSNKLSARGKVNSHCQTQAASVLKLLDQADPVKESPHQVSAMKCTMYPSVRAYGEDCYHHLALHLARHPASLSCWLSECKEILEKKCRHAPHLLIGLLCSILVRTDDEVCINLCLENLAAVAELDTSLAPDLLPVLLYKVSKDDRPRVKQHVLQQLPLFATHKVSVSPILRTIHVFGNCSALKPTALRMLTSLWIRQDRCFPHLQQMILEAGRGPVSAGMDEMLLSKATSIRDVCKHRPNQHGVDLLSPLSSILNDCTTDHDEVPAAMSLEGLFYLCQAEVIDIRTAWSVVSRIVSNEKRHLVIKQICKLLSLVPELNVETKEYQLFKNVAVCMLWRYADCEVDDVQVAAFTALAMYTSDSFTLLHLPQQISKHLVEAAEAERDDDEDVQLPDVPAECYTQLLCLTPESVLPGYERFLTSRVVLEVASLPRGVYHSSTRQQTGISGSQAKSMSAITTLLQQQYDDNREPSLRPSLAAGLLMTYTPGSVGSNTRKQGRHIVIRHGREYKHTLATLLQEVPVLPSQWLLCMQAPRAWSNFMATCYLTVIESRCAEVQQQQQSEEVGGDEETQLLQDTAWMWARDKLTDIIKSASRGSPAVQGNCLLALCGLAVASGQYAASLDTEGIKQAQAASEHLSQSHWLNMTTDTVMTILDPNFRPTGRIFNICQQRDSRGQVSASILARGCAATGLSELARVVSTASVDVITVMLDALCACLPHLSRDSSSVLHLHHGLGLGLLLGQLFNANYIELTGTKGMVQVWKAVDKLECCCLSMSQNRLGSILGLGVCVSAMCADGKMDSKVHVRSIREQLSAAQDMCDVTESTYEGFCVTQAIVSVSAYATNIMGQEVVDRAVARLYDIHCNQETTSGVSLALGTACYGLLCCNHPSVQHLSEKLSASWIATIQDQETPTLNSMSCLSGLMGLAGANKIYLTLGDQSSGKSSMSVVETVKVITSLINSTSNVALKGQCIHTLANVYTSTTSEVDTRTGVPVSYQYLGESSILSALVTLLQEASKRGPEQISAVHVSTALSALIKGAPQSLPPVNWAAFLSPLLRLPFGDDVQQQCLELAAQQSQGSSAAAMFVASWMVDPLYSTLTNGSKLLLYKLMPHLIKSVSPAKIQDYFDHGFLHPFTADDTESREEGCVAALGGLCASLAVKDPPQSVTLQMYQLLDTVYSQHVNKQTVSVWHAVTQCFKEIPDDLVDQITATDFEDECRHKMGLYARCHLVGEGHQPLACLNPAIEALMLSVDVSRQNLLNLLLECFCNHTVTATKTQDDVYRSQWLKELMGHMRNIANGVVQIVADKDMINKILELLLLVFGCAVTAWCGTDQAVALRAGATTHTSVPMSQPSDTSHLLWTSLPHSLIKMISLPYWSKFTHVIMDWLLAMRKAKYVENCLSINQITTACLFSLRDQKHFMKIGMWGEAVAFI